MYSVVKSKKTKGKSKHRPVRSVTISRADNGFTVHKEHEPGEGGMMDYQPSKPSVFSGDSALADAHNYSQQCFGGDMGAGDGDQGDNGDNGGSSDDSGQS